MSGKKTKPMFTNWEISRSKEKSAIPATLANWKDLAKWSPASLPGIHQFALAGSFSPRWVGACEFPQLAPLGFEWENLGIGSK